MTGIQIVHLGIMHHVTLFINKISGVAPSDQQPQLQKFLEGRNLWQRTALFCVCWAYQIN